MLLHGKEWSDEELLKWYTDEAAMIPQCVLALLKSDGSYSHICCHKEIGQGPEDITYFMIKGNIDARWHISLLLDDMKDNPGKYAIEL